MLNREILAVNQDPAGLAPVLVSQTTNMSAARLGQEEQPTSTDITAQVFARPLQGSEIAVVLLNRDETPANLSVTWRSLGLDVNQPMAVRDVANRKDLPQAVGRFESMVGKHDVSFVRLRPVAHS
jgi:alpha-galactosidase